MARLLALLLILVVLGTVVSLIATGLRKKVPTVKIMLIGINITLFGGIIAVDPHSTGGGIGYLIALSGLIISAVGLGKNDEV